MLYELIWATRLCTAEWSSVCSWDGRMHCARAVSSGSPCTDGGIVSFDLGRYLAALFACSISQTLQHLEDDIYVGMACLSVPAAAADDQLNPTALQRPPFCDSSLQILPQL